LVGDPLGKLYIPYIGIRGKGRKCCGCETILQYRWRVIGSPLIWTNWQDPFNVNCASPLQTEVQQTLYTLNSNSGGFVEGDFEGIYTVTRNIRGTIWFTGSWFEAYGTGRLNSKVVASTVFENQNGSADIDNSRLQRTFYGLGLGLEFLF
jgi:hypothetical protein